MTYDKTVIVAELEERLGRLNCLATSTKAQLLIAIRDDLISADHLHAYLASRLTFVERVIATISYSPFQELCHKLNDGDDLRLLRALGLSPPFQPENWLHHAISLRGRHDGCLYALANYYALALSPSKTSDVDAITLTACTLCGLDQGRLPDAVQLLESHLGLQSRDYSATDFRVILSHRLSGLAEISAAQAVYSLADWLPFVERRSDSLRLLEAHLGVSHSDYAAPTFPDWLSERLQALQVDSAAQLVYLLASSLTFANRNADGVMLLEAYLHLSRGEYTAPDFPQRLASTLSGIHADTAANFVNTLSRILSSVSRNSDGLRLIEAYLNLSPEDYAAAELLSCLQLRLRWLHRGVADHLVRTLASRLSTANRHLDTIELLESYFGMRSDNTYARHNLSRFFSQRRSNSDPNDTMEFIVTLAVSLTQALVCSPKVVP